MRRFFLSSQTTAAPISSIRVGFYFFDDKNLLFLFLFWPHAGCWWGRPRRRRRSRAWSAAAPSTAAAPNSATSASSSPSTPPVNDLWLVRSANEPLGIRLPAIGNEWHVSIDNLLRLRKSPLWTPAKPRADWSVRRRPRSGSAYLRLATNGMCRSIIYYVSERVPFELDWSDRQTNRSGSAYRGQGTNSIFQAKKKVSFKKKWTILANPDNGTLDATGADWSDRTLWIPRIRSE